MISGGLALKPVVTVSSGLTSKPVVTLSSGLASKLVLMVFSSLASKLVAMVFSNLASKLMATVSSSLASKSVVGFLVVPQNQVDGGFLDLCFKTGSFGLDLCLKITLVWTSKSSALRFIGCVTKPM
jgi:hypothetical protein